VDKTIEDDLLTQSQFARRWGLSRQYISKDADDCNYDQQFYEREA